MSNTELSNEVLVNLVKEGWDPDGRYMMQLWNKNQTLIRKTVEIYQRFDRMEDLMQEAFIGFREAVEQFDPDKEASFITYALFWVKAAVSKYIRNNGSLIRFPSHVYDLLSRKKKFIHEYRLEFAEDPSDQQIADALEISVDQLKDLEQRETNCRKISSLDKPFGEDEDLKLEDCLSDGSIPQEAVEEQIYKEQRARAVWGEVDQLPDRQRQVIRMRFKDDRTLEECAAALGINGEAVRNHQLKAVRVLGSGKHRKILVKYVDDTYSRALMGGIGSFRRTHTSTTERLAIKNLEEHRSAMERIAAFIIESEEEVEKESRSISAADK